MANTSKKFNMVRVVSEYYMMKKVLGNQYANDILNKDIQPAGPTAAADKKTLQQMKAYVDQFGKMKVATSGIGKSETVDAMLTRLTNKFIKLEASKPEKDRVEFSDNPFDDRFPKLVESVLAMENAQGKIDTSLQVNTQVAEQIAALPVLLGGKKQSSYIRLLSQSTELFSSISGLEDQITKLKESGTAKDAQIQQLQGQLDEQVKKAQEYKTMIDQALQGTTAEDSKAIIALLNQTNEALASVTKDVAVQGRATRVHVTNEADRVIENVSSIVHDADKIRGQLFSNPNKYRYFHLAHSGKHLNVSCMERAYDEIKDAAKMLNISPESDSVLSVYNKLNELNLAHQNLDAKGESKGKKVAKYVGIGLALVIAGGAAGYLIGQATAANTPTTLSNDAFEQAYSSYAAQENQQKQDYMDKLQTAVENGTLFTLDNQVSPTSETGETVWNQETLKQLRNQYAQDDQLDSYNWSSTSEIDAATNAAIANAMADYYESNYTDLLGQVANLNSQIQSLQDQLKGQGGDKADLQNQIVELQAQVQQLQDVIDAANAKYDSDTSELQGLVDELRGQVSDLQTQNGILTNENQQLKDSLSGLENQIADLLDQVSRLKYENSVLSTDKAGLQTQVNALQKQIDQLQGQVGTGGGNDTQLQAQIDALQEQLDQANATIQSLTEENQQLTDQILQLKQNLSNLESSVNDLESAVDSLTSENSSLKGEVSQLTQDLDASIASYSDLYEQYQALLNSGSNQSEIEALRAELQDAYDLIQQYESKIVSFYNGLTKSNTTNEQAMQDLEQLLNLFNINYSETSTPSYGSSSEYQPGA